VLYLAWLMDGRNGEDYYAFDLLSDVMSLGRSSFFYQHLVKVKKICAHVDAYITGTEDRGLFIIEARPANGVSMEDLEAAIWDELELIQKLPVDDLVLAKLKNKNESTMSFSNVSASHKAANLAYYESLGDAELINTEVDRISEVTKEHLHLVVNQLRKDNVNILQLKSNGQELVAASLVEEDDEEED
jgi:predicted Zn-dependent peptidase